MSFQKKSQKKGVRAPPGTRASVYRNQLLVSTGIPSLDRLMDGGMGVGTVLLIEEDRYGSYSKVMFKYYLAESFASGHKLLVATSNASVTADSLLNELPQTINYDPEPETKKEATDELEIAWRYQKSPSRSHSEVQPLGHYFDLSKTMDISHIELNDEDRQLQIMELSQMEFNVSENLLMNPAYRDVLSRIEQTVIRPEFSTDDSSSSDVQKNVLRVALHSLGSPLWNEGCLTEHSTGYDPSLIRFLLALRRLMRTSYCVCLLTLPVHTIQDEVFLNRIRHFCDSVVRLESFACTDKESNPVFKDYHGFFHVIKQARLNSPYIRAPDTTDLAFKLRRKKFTIEKMHLPPELSETPSRSQEETLKAKPKPVTCGSGKSLEF